MRVRGSVVRCSFPRHASAYTVLDTLNGKPRAQPMHGTTKRTQAVAVIDAVCVDESIWRYIVVPGVVEVRLFDRINSLPGASAELFPGKDTFDIGVLPAGRSDGPPAWEFTLDVKDFASAQILASKLSSRPVAARHIVLPDYRRHQVPELRRSLPAIQIATQSTIVRQIKTTAAPARESE
jgi:REase associating with pPIWI_RE